MRTKKIASILLIVASISWGCKSNSSTDNESIDKEQVQQTEQVQQKEKIQLKEQVQQEKSPSGEPDQYGRKPGDQHYGHNHAPAGQQPENKTNTQPQNTTGEPDKFGRKPGDPHYGHNHE